MDNSDNFKLWQKNLFYLEKTYDIRTGVSENIRMRLLHQIKVAADALPAEIAGILGRKKGKSIMHFLKTTAGTIIELQKILSISLSMNLVTISEYHSISQSLNELGEMLKALDNRIYNKQTGDIEPETENDGYWLLN